MFYQHRFWDLHRYWIASRKVTHYCIERGGNLGECWLFVLLRSYRIAVLTSGLVLDFRSSTGWYRRGRELLDISAYNSDEATAAFHEMICDKYDQSLLVKPTRFHKYLEKLAASEQLLHDTGYIENNLPEVKAVAVAAKEAGILNGTNGHLHGDHMPIDNDNGINGYANLVDGVNGIREGLVNGSSEGLTNGVNGYTNGAKA
ncbi:hypothetical protein MMC17_004547 [Xylographa soralifera]|nr:hypothetical protein [Xylographa soralifera]